MAKDVEGCSEVFVYGVGCVKPVRVAVGGMHAPRTAPAIVNVAADTNFMI
jgi:hypothetical protein